MRALVTGGAGFIGSRLVRSLRADGHEVVVLDDLSTGDAARVTGAPGVTLLVGDVRDPSACATASAGADAVFHLAAEISVPRSVEEPERTADVNVLGTVRVLEAARRAGSRRFVLASSCAVYGDSARDAQSEDDAPRPASPYAASKLAGEEFVRAFTAMGLPGVSLRFFNVHGPGQRPGGPYAAVMQAFRTALAAGQPPRIDGDGRQSRDFVHVDDVVRACRLAVEAPESACGGAYNVGTGRATTVLELARLMGRAHGVDVTPVHAAPRPGDLRRSLADTRRSREVLGFAATVRLEDALDET